MEEPSIRKSRLAIAGGLAAAIALGGVGFAIGRSTAPQPEPPAPTATTPAPAPAPPRDATLRRAELIDLAERATDALTLGEDAREALAPAIGQRFELMIPFGCSGPDESGPAMRWSYDEADGTLRITVESTSWDPARWGLDAGAGQEVVEGFWISRPWSSSETCPDSGSVVPPDSEAITLPGQTLAIAQFFAEGDSRDARRDGRPYELVKRVPPEEFDGSRGFRLRVSGRIAAVPGGGPVRCVQPAGAQQRPLCAIGARLDEVAIENPVTGGVIGSWHIDAAG